MFEKIRGIMLDYVDVDPESITLETRFLADLNMNSLDIMDMVGRMEDEFDVTIETEDLNTIFTVGELIDYLAGLGVTE
ncbi:MAG: acyl carrier protein [Clostridia bacterium]|nr:acyl carrier protein [Clostridia bacterium]MBQ9879057.1 acyl carrier protein [Clostridia bacterium]